MIVNPNEEQKLIYTRFCHYLNRNGGKLDANDAVYYRFLDVERITHETLVIAIKLCHRLYPQKPYVLHIDARTVKVEGGAFYLTKTGTDIISNAKLEDMPPIEGEERKNIVQELLPEILKAPTNNTKQRKDAEWSKDEVIELLTTQAHIVGRMLGTGYDLMEQIHSDWIAEWITNPKGLRVTIHQAHRDSYKTSAARLMLAIMLILQPTKTIIIIRKSEDAVKEIVNGVSKILDTPLFKTFVNILYPYMNKFGGFKKTTDTALAIDTNLNVSLSGEYQLRALGLGSPLTGKHASLIITDDICFVAGTKIATPLGDKNIEDIKSGDYVITPQGYNKVVNTSSRLADVIDKCGLIGTPNHPIYNKNKNRFDNLIDSCNNNLCNITLEDLKQWQIAKQLLSGMDDNGKGQAENIISYGHLIAKGLEKCYIEQSGKSIMAKYLPTMSYTIKTTIPTIIALAIWSVYTVANIKECTPWNVLSGAVRTWLKKLSQPSSNGSKQTKAWLCAKQMQKKCTNFVGKTILKWSSVQNAELNTVPILEPQLDCAGDVENLQQTNDITIDKNQQSIIHTLIQSVKSAVRYTGHVPVKPINMDCAKTVQNGKDIEKNKPQRVYNLEVEGCHAYYANGILVHNCTTSDRESEAERRATISKYQEMMNLLSNNKGFSDTRILNIGTPWHEEDAFNLMERGLKPKTEEQKELEEIPVKKRTEEQSERIRRLDMLRGKFVYNCYQTGLMTIEDIEWKRQVLNDEVLFAANYLLTLVSDEECPFPRIKNTGVYSKDFFAESYETYAQIDAKYSGIDTCALTIGAYDWDNMITVVYGRLWKVPIDQNYLELAEIMYDCGVQKLYMETNTDKGLMGDKFRELGIDTEGYHEHTNKDTKIVNTLRPFWREKGDYALPCVHFTSETDEEYLSQIYNYKRGVKRDDAPDSLASLLLKSKFGRLAVRIT